MTYPPTTRLFCMLSMPAWELDGKKSEEEDQQDRKPVKQAIDNEGRKNRALADIFLFSQNKGPDEFAQPGGQYVIRHVTDYGGGKEIAEPRLFQAARGETASAPPGKNS